MTKTCVGAGTYLEEAGRRLERIRSYLENPQGGGSSAVEALWDLWVLREASEEAGYEEISRLFARLESSVLTAEPPGNSKAGAKRSAILDAVEYIRRHAGYVALGMEAPPLPATVARKFGIKTAPLGLREGRI